MCFSQVFILQQLVTIEKNPFGKDPDFRSVVEFHRPASIESCEAAKAMEKRSVEPHVAEFDRGVEEIDKNGK